MGLAGVLLSAVLYALAFPPIDWSALAWIALVPLLLVARADSAKTSFYFGCLFGYAFGWSTMWALAEAAARYFQLPIAVGVAGVGLYYLVIAGIPCGVFALGTRFVLRCAGYRTVLIAVPSMWVAAELVRGRVFDQPWALFGYSQHEHVELLQIATWTGVYGVSFLLVLVNLGLAEGIWRLARRRPAWSSAGAVVAPAVVVGACWLAGALLTRSQHGNDADDHAPRVAIVQTNIAPSLRWTRSYVDSQIAAHLRATDALSESAAPALIVWPESAIPRYLESEPHLAEVISRAAQRRRADILFGVPRYDGGRSFNSVRLITAAGRNGGFYDKQRLVPLAEERPSFFSSGASETDEATSFVSGSASPVLQSFARLGVSVCHEIIHPDLVDAAVREGAELLVNVANDGWLGQLSSGAAEQHLSMAVFRAVETRRFLVRAAITGVSAVIDPYGRIVASLPSGQAGVLVAPVQAARGMTSYVLFGDVFAYTCMALALMIPAFTGLASRSNPAAHLVGTLPLPSFR